MVPDSDLDSKADALAEATADGEKPYLRFRRVVDQLDALVAAGRISGIVRRRVIERAMRKEGLTAKTNREARSGGYSTKRSDVSDAKVDALLREIMGA